jgi:predicted membrane-bound dolichyl-phosphate-mannose-protein mannosyltransferase
MKKLLIMILLVSCSKNEQKISDEVLLTVTSECRCAVKIYNMDDRQYLSDVYDCSYQKILPLKMERGAYKIKAENYQGKVVSKIFTKGNYSQNLNIEF